jgi:hypothetical protein
MWVTWLQSTPLGDNVRHLCRFSARYAELWVLDETMNGYARAGPFGQTLSMSGSNVDELLP